MKKHYTTVLILLLTAFAAQAQRVEYIDANNTVAGIPVHGNLFYEADTAPQHYPEDTFFLMFEVPKGTGIKNSFNSALWLTGEDANGNLHCSAQYVTQVDYFDGPIASMYNQAYTDYYSRVFKITRAQVDAHRQLSLSTTWLQIDNAIRMWPAKGNPFVGTYHQVNIADKLAPFVDVNGDGMYDPRQGDYPDFCGEQAVFFVFNDLNGPQHDSTGTALGVEVRGMAEQFVDYSNTMAYGKRAVNNTLYVHYEIENKSTNTYSNFLVGRMHHNDLGCFENDFIGCDTNRNLMYGYNGTTDVSCQGITGLDGREAAMGVKFLNNKLAAFGPTLYIWNQRANSATEYKNNMEGKWLNGMPYTYGGNGTGDSTAVVKHMYTGNPNNLAEWSERSAFQPAGDRSMIGAAPATTLVPGQIIDVDLAFFVAYDTVVDSTLTRYTIVDTLLRDADIIQAFYNNEISACRATQQPVGISEKRELQL
ncbi:MAG: hypothetical protein JST49_02190, partial [Bacteroidetes bacterium]|nr:hypothetical protein [Bacteroidota bacterium]